MMEQGKTNKKKVGKRILAICMALILLVGMLPVSAFAEDNAPPAAGAAMEFKEVPNSSENEGEAPGSKEDDKEDKKDEKKENEKENKKEEIEEEKKTDEKEKTEKTNEPVPNGTEGQTPPAQENGGKGNAKASANAKAPKQAALARGNSDGDSANLGQKKVIGYEVSVFANLEHGGTVSGGGMFDSGEKATVKAIANEGFRFVEWQKDGSAISGAGAEYTFEVSEDVKLTAVFEKIQHSLSVEADPSEGGTVSGTSSGTYDYGKNVKVTATAKSGYYFAGWFENQQVVAKTAVYEFTLKADRALTARFVEDGNIMLVFTSNWDRSESGSDWEDSKLISMYSGTYMLAAPPDENTVKAKRGYEFNCIYIPGCKDPYKGYVYAGQSFAFSSDMFNEWYGRTTPITVQYLWKQLTEYKVTVEADPIGWGTVESSDPNGKYYKGETATVTATANTGYEFDGWYEGTTKVSSDAEYKFTVSADRDLVAKFKKAKYTVTVKADPTGGGTVSGGGTYEYGGSVTVTATPKTSDGYFFEGWYEGDTYVDYHEDYTFTVDRNITLTAKFNKMYTVTLDMNGGKIEDHTTGTLQGTISEEMPGGYSQDIPLVADMKGYIDGGWIMAPANKEYIGIEITDKDGTKTYQPGDSYTVVSDVTLKVLWKSTVTPSPTTYTVTFKDGETVIKTETVAENETVAEPAVPTKDGHTFVGWFADSSFNTPFDFTKAITEDTTVYAMFTQNGVVVPVTYTVTFKDGEKVLATQKVTKGENATEPAASPTKDGATFAGWYADSSFNTPFDFTKAITEDTTVYAMFTQNGVLPPVTMSTISFDLNGGTWDGRTGIVTISGENGSTIILPLPTREGYVFDYWKGSRYEAGEEYTIDGDHTLVAQWKPANNNGSNNGENNNGGNSTTPETGDTSHAALWMLLVLVSFFGIAYTQRKIHGCKKTK